MTGISRPSGTGPHGSALGGGDPLPVMAGTIIDASPQILILHDADGEQRLVLPPGIEVWKGRRVEPTGLEPGDSVLVRLLPGQRNVADRIWANIGRATGVIVSRNTDGVLVEQARTTPHRMVAIPGQAAGRLQVRFPRLEPGYLIDVIGIRHPGYLEAVLPATSQPVHRTGDPVAPARGSRGMVAGPLTGSATWHELAGPDEPPGIRYPALDPDSSCREQGQARPLSSRQRLPYLSAGSLVAIRNDCTGLAQVLPVSGCAPSSRLFDDRCVTCGTSPRGRVAVLPMVTFTALGGELERACFNATISVGAMPGGDP